MVVAPEDRDPERPSEAPSSQTSIDPASESQFDTQQLHTEQLLVETCMTVVHAYIAHPTLEGAMACQAVHLLAQQLELSPDAWDPDPFTELDACMRDWEEGQDEDIDAEREREGQVELSL